MSTVRLPIGVVLGAVGVDVRWWLDSARRLDAAGYAGIWSWEWLGWRSFFYDRLRRLRRSDRFGWNRGRGLRW